MAPPNFSPHPESGHIQTQTLKQYFSEFNWFETIQHKLILAYLSCSKNAGVNVWCDLVDELHRSSLQASQVLKDPKTASDSVPYLIAQFKVRFSAHLAILLMLHDRIENS